MEFLLFFIMFIICIISIIASGYQLTHPAVLFSGVWCVSSLGCCFSTGIMHEKLEATTLTFLILLNLVFVVTTLFCSSNVSKKNQKYDYSNGELPKVKVSKYFVIFFLFFYMLASFYLYKDLLRMASTIGDIKSFSDIFRLARYADTMEITSYSFLSTYILRFNIAIGIVSIYYASKYFFLKQKKPSRTFLLFFLISMVFTFFSAARNQAIMLISSALFTSLYNFYYYSPKRNRTLFKKALGAMILSGVVFILIFIFMGVFLLDRMKDGSLEGVIYSLIEYISGPILAFNYFIKNVGEYTSPYFGAYSFTTLNNLLTHLGILENPISAIAPFMNNGYLSVNVYTLYFRYMVDFGVFGTFFLTMIDGILYGLLFRICLTHKDKSKVIPIVSLLIYGVIMSFFEEKIFTFLNGYLTIIVMIVIVKYVFDKVSLKNKKKKYFIGCSNIIMQSKD